MAIKRLDEYQHNNPDLSIVDSDNVDSERHTEVDEK